jgi:gamma-glutamylcyclotransferase (GGCT)/AIG2-like uncharacterized protein YtfP
MLIAVYGTLRKGEYNHEYIQGYEPLSTERVEGFEMYNLSGMYPYIARGADSITVEVYDLPEGVVARVESMERGAGYDMCTVQTTKGNAQIFYMPEEEHAVYQSAEVKRPPKILSGDWFPWLRNYKPERLLQMEGDSNAI